MTYVSNVVSAIFNFYIAYSLFSFMLGKAIIEKKLQLLVFAGVVVMDALAAVFVDKSTFILPFVMLASVFICSLTYQGQLYIKCLVSILLTVIFALCEVSAGMFLVALTHLDMVSITENHTLYIFGVLLSNVLALFLIKFIGHIKYTSKVKLSPTLLVALLLSSIVSLAPLYIIMKFSYELVGLSNTITVIVVSVLLIVSNLALFHFFEVQLTHEQQKIEYDFMCWQFDVQAEYYQKLVAEQETVNKTIHDIKNTLLAIQGCIVSDDHTGAVRRISEICENLSNRTKIYTSNIVVDTILNAKQKEAKNEGFDFEIFASSFEGGKIDAIDLGIILGNALDNAIEACKKIPKAKGREIYTKIFRIDDYVSIVIENSVDKPVEIVDGMIASTKKGGFHGYGIKNIKALVEKYDGDVQLHYDANKFSISMLLKSS